MNFQNDVNSVLEVVRGLEIVQNTSIFSEESDKRTFKYEFLLRTPLGRTFQRSKNVQNLIFQNFRMSSDVEVCLICSEMRSLDALEVFCTVSGPNMISQLYFMAIENFMIFRFVICGFFTFHCQNSYFPVRNRPIG